MSWNVKKNRRPFVAALALVVLIAGAVAGWPRLKNRYVRWDAKSRIARAEQALSEKDYNRAVLSLRAVLAADPANVDAIRMVARVLDAAGSPEAIQWWSRLDSLQPGNADTILAWAAAAMKTGDTPTAERVLGMLAPARRETAAFHVISAKIAQSKKETEDAAKHWAEAVRIAPDEPGHRLALGAIRLRSQDSKQRDEAIAMLTGLVEKTPPNLDAIRILLDYALRLEDWKRADALSKMLVADSTATISDKLHRLTALRKMGTQEAPGYLLDLRTAGLSNPGELYLLFMWMNQNNLAMMVSEWSRTLERDIIGVTPVCVAVADAYARSSDWQRLREFLDGGAWGEQEYLRRAFLSRALERLDEPEAGATEWNDGLSAARSRGDSRERLDRMVRLAIGWGWTQRAQEVMWSLAGTPACPRWILDRLWLVAIEKKDAAQLQKLAGVLARVDSKSVIFRNDFAFYSLLIRSDNGNPHGEAEKLFTENPGDQSVLLTRALSLYVQGDPAGAAALTGSLPAEALKRPRTALYHAIFLTAAGESAKASEFVTVAQDWKMFPEEKTMLDRAKTIATKAAGDQEIATTAKAMRAAKVARDLEAEKEIAASAKALRAAKAARDLEAEKAVVAARAERLAKAAQAAQEAAQSPAPEKSGGQVPPR